MFRKLIDCAWDFCCMILNKLGITSDFYQLLVEKQQKWLGQPKAESQVGMFTIDHHHNRAIKLYTFYDAI